MKNLTFKLMNILILIALALPIFAQNATGTIEGNWLGTLEISGLKMRLLLKVAKSAGGDGSYSAKLDSIDQGAKDLPVDSIKLAGGKMSFSAAQFGMTYEGTLNEKADEISGTFKQFAGSTPFVFRRITDVPKRKRPQDPIKPYPYAEEEVVYKNTKDNVKLAGTLTFPRGNGGKHPAVILITGSGIQDRDSTIAEHRPFLVLSDHLTKKGIAVLRVDDRGAGGSDLGSLSATTENFVGDVLAGIEYLKTRKEIDPKQIGLIGHSEGGIIAPMVAARSKDIRFIVMLSGTGQTGAGVILTQLTLLQKASGARDETINEAVDFQKSLLSLITSEPDDKQAEQKINEMMAKRKSKMNERELKEFGQVEANLKSQLPLLLSPWYRYFLAYNPRPTLEKIRIPVLALNGESDVQVASKENLTLISEALKAGRNKDFTVKSLPKLNHLFQTSQTGLPNEYGVIEETIAPWVLEIVSSWISERTIKK
jgi:pimeloyl-ACP methyl ester carboxylesterase